MVTGDGGLGVPDPNIQEPIDMIKKMALCAILILILIPAFAMAAGPQGQGSGTAPGSGMQVQEEIAGQEQAANHEQISFQMQNNGEEQRLQNRICSQECERFMVMTQNQHEWSVASATGQLTLSSSADQNQDLLRGRDRLQDGTGDGIPDRLRDRLKDGSCKDLLSSSVDQDLLRGRDRLQDGTGDGIPDRLRERLRDGSCKDLLSA